jgi:hypothetical protein
MRGARVASFCLAVCVGAAVTAAEVPAPPSESGLAPNSIFNDDGTYVPPDPGTSGTVSPDQVYTTPVSTTTASPQRYYYTPSSSSSAGGFPFAGYNGGGVIPIGGKVDELFGAGIQIVVETGWQMSSDDGFFSDIAVTAGFSNQTIWGKDNHSFILPNGEIHGTDTLSISTFKSGVYVGNSLGGFDSFTGVYGKLGAAILNENVEFFTPENKYYPVDSYKDNAFVGGGGIEAGIALWKFDRGSLAFISGVECLYMDTFDYGGSKWTLFSNSGFQWEFDITDGLFPDQTWERNRLGRTHCRRHRRHCR